MIDRRIADSQYASHLVFWNGSNIQAQCGSRCRRWAWAGEKSVLHKLRFHPDFVAPFSPPCEGGVRGGWARHDQSQGLPMLCPSQSFRIPLARREESFSLSKARAAPPLPPLRKGGKGIARSRRHSIPRNKNTR